MTAYIPNCLVIEKAMLTVVKAGFDRRRCHWGRSLLPASPSKPSGMSESLRVIAGWLELMVKCFPLPPVTE